FFRLRIDWRKVIPHALQRDSLGVVKVPLQCRDFSFWRDGDATLFDEGSHFFFFVSPIGFDAQNFIEGITLRRTAWTGEIVPTKPPPVWVFVAIVRLNVRLVQRRVLLIPNVIGSTGVKQKHVMQPTVVLASLPSITMGCAALPNDFVLKIVLAQNL